LKDASAISIYGSRAMNGVVVITTKNGGRGSKMKINYSQEQTIRMVLSYSQYNILNSQETMGILQEMQSKGFLSLPSVTQGRAGGVYNLLSRSLYDFDSLQPSLFRSTFVVTDSGRSVGFLRPPFWILDHLFPDFRNRSKLTTDPVLLFLWVIFILYLPDFITVFITVFESEKNSVFCPKLKPEIKSNMLIILPINILVAGFIHNAGNILL